MPKEGNFAFIDSQNIIQGVENLGWKLDWRRFRRYLYDKYNVTRAILFLGYVPKNIYPYYLRSLDGFFLHFRHVTYAPDGKIKGNVDVNLTLEVMRSLKYFDKAVLVSSDGDFYPLAEYLLQIEKLEAVLSPHIRSCSKLLKQVVKSKMDYLDPLREKIARKWKSTAKGQNRVAVLLRV